MELKDLFLSPIYLILIYLFAYSQKRKLTNKLTSKYFIPALTIKIFGAVIFAFIYQFYYGTGDTYGYFEGAKNMANSFLDNPIITLKILYLNANEFTADTIKYTSSTSYFKADSEWFLIKIATLINLLTFNTYIVTSFFFAVFAFLGTWKLYIFFLQFHPKLYNQLAICILFIPSCIFWASGLLKDTITLGAICFFTYYAAQVLFFKKQILKSLIICIIMLFLLINIKAYIIISFLPGMVFWTYLRLQENIKTPVIRFLIKGLVILVMPIIVFFLGIGLVNQIEKSTQFKAMQEVVKGYHGDHGNMGGEASTYILTKIDYSLTSMLSIMPTAINVTLFRPYLWEAKKPIVLITALESTSFLLITIYLIIRTGIFKSFKSVLTNPEVILCLSFTIILGFVVGLTSYNFGALARFKAPLMPYYVSGLFMMYDLSKRKKLKPKRNIKKHFIT